MKKFLLSLVAVLAAITVNAQTTKLTIVPPNQWWGSKDVTVSTSGKIDYSNQYGEFNIKKNLSLATYTGMILQYKDASNAQVKIQGDADDASTYSKKVELCFGLDGVAGEQTFEFPASLGSNILALSLQGLEAGATITFEKITLLKGEEKEVVTDFAGMSWGGSYTAIATSGVDMLITDSYGEIGFKEAVSYEAGKAYTYDITFSEPTPDLLQFKVQTNADTPGALFNEYDSKYYVYQDIPAGSTSASIIVNYEYKGISLPCPTANQTFKGIQANLTVSDAAAIQSVVSSAKSGKFVENGQVVIYKNGKKFNVAGIAVK